MKLPSLKSVLTNPFAKSAATLLTGAAAAGASAGLEVVKSGAPLTSSGIFSAVLVGFCGYVASHNILSAQRDRAYGETATPPSVARDINTAALVDPDHAPNR